MFSKRLKTFKDISQAAKEASAGVAGLTAVGGAGSDSLTQVLARLGLDKSTLEEIPNLLEDIEEELNSLRTLGGAQIAVQGVNRGLKSYTALIEKSSR